MVHRPLFRPSSIRGRAADARADFLERAPIASIRLVLAPEDEVRIDTPERPSVKATLLVDGRPLPAPVGVKIKGSAGSSRPWSEHPALTVQVAKFDKSQRFHGMAKFHLNNSVQDGSRLEEWTGSCLFRLAGYPAPRVGHARLNLGDREMGLVVLKEGFDQGFLDQAFADSQGTLYEGAFVGDIDGELERDIGTGPVSRKDLIALTNACRDPDPARRRTGLARCLNVGAFLTFATLERMLGHWDGYVHNTNNYRLYFEPRGVGVFLPHGMDQLFRDPQFPLAGGSNALVAAAVLGFPEWDQMQRKLVAEYEPLLRPGGPLELRLDAAAARAGELTEGARDLRSRLRDRHAVVRKFRTAWMIGGPSAGVPRRWVPVDWKPANPAPGIRFVDARGALGIAADQPGSGSASWRTTLRLPMGRYLLRAKVAAEGVVAVDASLGSGAGIRVSGATRTERVVGTTSRVCVFPVTVDAPEADVVLVLELRSATGKVWFAKDSLVVERSIPIATPVASALLPRVPKGGTPRIEAPPATR
ncbi:MAG: CotH kinase family protein [Armatimonadota bacterium]